MIIPNEIDEKHNNQITIGYAQNEIDEKEKRKARQIKSGNTEDYF